jgi:hypothetical protein
VNARLSFALFISFVCGILIVVFPDLAERVTQLLVLGLLAAVLLEIAARGRRYSSRTRSLLDGPLETAPPAPQTPSDLADLERALGWRTYEQREFDHRVRPVLGRLLTYRIRARHGIDPATDPAAARRLLDPALMELIDPPPETSGPGTRSTADIASLVDRIEEL